MKNILNLIFAISVLSFSITSFARSAAAGDDPNLPIINSPEAGTMVLGADLSAQKPVCQSCQNRNNLTLGSGKDIYVPGSTGTGSSGTSGQGEGHK